MKNAMKKMMLMLCCGLSVAANAQQWNWGVSAGGPSNRDVVWDIATDSRGNVYWAGSVSGTDNFDCGTAASGILQRGILAKYDSLGVCQWVRTVTTPSGNVTAYGVAIDAADRVYLSGSCQGTMTFSDGITVPGSGSGEHWFVARYTADGTCLWARRGGGEYSSQAHDLAVGTDGTIYVAGTATGEQLVFPPLSLPSDELVEQMALVAYDSTGTALWARATQGGTSNAEVWGLSVAAGRVFVTGVVSGEDVRFGGEQLCAAGAFNGGLFVLGATTDGDALWAHTMGNALSYGMGISADTLGNVFVTGLKNGTMTLPDGNTLDAGQEEDIILLGFGADGTFRWAHVASGAGFDRAGDVEVDDAGNAYVVFEYENNIDFLGTPMTFTSTNRIGMAKLRADGDVVWAAPVGTGAFETGLAVHQRRADERKLYFGGVYWNTAQYGSSTLNDNGNGDAMLVSGIDTTFDVSIVARPTCPQACTGEVFAVCNGDAPFNCTWNTGATDPALHDLCADQYAVVVTDALGHARAATAVVGTATDPGLVVHAEDDSLWVEGGSGWQWYGDGELLPGANDPYLIAPISGAYHVNYMDGTDCTWSTAPITVELGVGLVETQGPAHLVAYPNPTHGMIVVQWNGASVAQAELINGAGQRVRTERLVPGANTLDLRSAAPGPYLLRTSDGRSVRIVKE